MVKCTVLFRLNRSISKTTNNWNYETERLTYMPKIFLIEKGHISYDKTGSP